MDVSREVFERLARIETTVENIADMMTKSEVRHESFSDRLADLERGNEVQKRLNRQIQHHLDNDTPIEVREGQHAVAIVKYVGGMLASAGVGALCVKLFGG